MGDKHRKDRYGETWEQARIDACLRELQALRTQVVFSGGWAWHFMSPVGHVELKHAHDHKDIDLFVPRENVQFVILSLKALGFEAVRTQWDNHPESKANGFRRYEKSVPNPGTFNLTNIKITIDFFVVPAEGIPERTINGWRVVDPKHLITLYKSIHSSGSCFAVQAASRLLAAGIDPVGHPDLVKIPT